MCGNEVQRVSRHTGWGKCPAFCTNLEDPTGVPHAFFEEHEEIAKVTLIATEVLGALACSDGGGAVPRLPD